MLNLDLSCATIWKTTEVIFFLVNENDLAVLGLICVISNGGVIFHFTNERSHWIKDNISNPNLNNSILLKSVQLLLLLLP